MSNVARNKMISSRIRKVPASPKNTEKKFFEFELFVAGDAPNSALAFSNLVAYCNSHLRNRHHIEVVNVYEDPARALAEGVLLTPMLLRRFPRPSTRVVGTLGGLQAVMSALDTGAGSGK